MASASTSRNVRGWVAGQNQIVLNGKRKQRAVVFSRQWPDTAVGRSVDAFQAGNLLLRPNQAVAVEVQVTKVRCANEKSVANELRTVINQRLQSRGFTANDNAETRLHVDYHETNGGTITHHRGDPFPTYVTESTIMAQVLHGSRGQRRTALEKYSGLGLVERDGMFLKIKIGRHKIRDGAPGVKANSTNGHLAVSLKSPDGTVIWKK